MQSFILGQEMRHRLIVDTQVATRNALSDVTRLRGMVHLVGDADSARMSNQAIYATLLDADG